MKKNVLVLLGLCLGFALQAQDYYLKKYHPFQKNIETTTNYLGFEVGEQHSRHDQIVGYLETLASQSKRAKLIEYGRTYEGRALVILAIGTEANIANLENLKTKHLENINLNHAAAVNKDLPIFVNLAYSVHGNEPSSSEAALLTAYTLVASEHPEIKKYREQAVVFLDPTINPDGRDRHTYWANMYKGQPLVSDPQDAEHNEYWPGGRTNHYWFDLNRDWLLGVHPESRGKLKWFHNWYPNVVTDFHEMGTNSTYFFEPMKPIASKDPIMPKDNYGYLNDVFGADYAKSLDSIGSLYFTKEVFDGTYPGYGSSYPDLQGALAILFEQASSRGHVQETPHGKITFPFTIRNHFITSLSTVASAVKHKDYLRNYQRRFFQTAIQNAKKSSVQAYEFNDAYDNNRVKAFIDKLLIHKIKVYRNKNKNGFVVPTAQPQYRMVQTMFESYKEYKDSVYYDASAWSMVHFYNMKYRAVKKAQLGEEVNDLKDLFPLKNIQQSNYAYVIDGTDYNIPAMMHYLLKKKVNISTAFKPFRVDNKNFDYGSVVIPVQTQKIKSSELFGILKKVQDKFQIQINGVGTGYSKQGIDLGSRNVRPVRIPKAALLIGTGVRSYDAGEVWHLLDTKVQMPITKIPIRNFSWVNLDKYNTLVMVSGRYNFSKPQKEKLQSWLSKGNTLITLGSASSWAIGQKLVKEKLIPSKKDTTANKTRLPYVDAGEHLGKESVGGAIFSAYIDNTHPLGFGYKDKSIPVYKNNKIWLAPSKSRFSTVLKYTENPHVDGFITNNNLNNYLKKSAPLIVSRSKGGTVILFGNNPNFRGSWFGTNRLFLNALFLGNHIRVPN
ncbi:MAG: M14 family metallopeptidase [Flavobacteriaceae bacterium]|nr:M14 family metallopeptidase [Flavobacteriaceae bacterium]